MRMICNDYGLNIQFMENTIVSIQIDSPDMFLSFMTRLWMQYDGNEDFMIFSEKDKEIQLGKIVDIVADPFQVEINNRKILSNIYQGIIETSQESKIEQMLNLQSSMEQYIIEVCEKSEYPLTYDANPDFAELLKMFNVRIDINEMDMASKLISYVKLSHRLLNTKLFIFVNLRTYFSEDKLYQMLYTLCYENIYILLIERFAFPVLDFERRIIVDKDYCVINDS